MKSKKILIAFSITLLSTAILINNPHSVHAEIQYSNKAKQSKRRLPKVGEKKDYAEIQLLGTIIVVGGVILGIRTLRKNHEN